MARCQVWRLSSRRRVVCCVTIFLCMAVFLDSRLFKIGYDVTGSIVYSVFCWQSYTPLPPSGRLPFHPVYTPRRQQSDSACSKVNDGAIKYLLRYQNITYCHVTKAGCTFWNNVFRFLFGDTGGKSYASPLEIPRALTHDDNTRGIMRVYGFDTCIRKDMSHDLRFMFVRDPYSRLFSAYLDKFVLPDFWHTEGQIIIRYRKHRGDKSTSCASDITFSEFADYVVTSGEPRDLNNHWKPFKFMCSPCLFRPDVIGKMETFSHDARYILDKLNLSWILDGYDADAHALHEMAMLIDDHYNSVRQGQFYKGCISTTELATRLWKVFQTYGYLPADTPLPEPQGTQYTANQLKESVREIYRVRPAKSREIWKRQRRQAMIKAYNTVSRRTLEKLRQLYWDDCQLFGYDPNPPIQ